MAFAVALQFLIDKLEGGYTLSTDVGGNRTYAGIIERTWTASAYGKRPFPPDDRNLIGSFYYDVFWRPYRCEELPEPADAVWFQCAVNLPYEEAIYALQNAVSAFPDGLIGNQTMYAVDRAGRAALPDLILACQMAHYRQRYLHDDYGLRPFWNRVQKVRDALALGELGG